VKLDQSRPSVEMAVSALAAAARGAHAVSRSALAVESTKVSRAVLVGGVARLPLLSDPVRSDPSVERAAQASESPLLATLLDSTLVALDAK
jgi:hypothetical protein